MTREELTEALEKQRRRLNAGIERKEPYEQIYRESVKMDRLLEQYLAAENTFEQHMENG